jgi:LPS export ABC transporter protein LptC
VIGRFLTPFAVLVVIVASLYLGRARDTTPPTVTEARDAQNTGYAATDAQIVETGIDGRPLYTLDADRIIQQPDAATVELEGVEMDYRDASGNRWRVRARNGRILEDATRVDLAGDVHVAGTPPGEYENAEIRTEQLTFDTRRERVETTESVTLTWSGRVLHARGLVADLKGEHVRLESRVHGSFTPQ